jgi:thioredoxin reductase (NADPH)
MTGEELEFDVVILGSGPAGLQAAVHAARTHVRVAVLGKIQSSSLFRAHIENYCCMSSPIAGEDVLNQGREQARRFGAAMFEQDVLGIEDAGDGRCRVSMESGQVLLTWTVILSMGISRNKLNVPGEKELLGKGVSYCVDCDANFFRNQPVAVVGDGSAAASGALTLLLTASEVYLICKDQDVSEHLGYQVESSRIEVHRGRKVKEILGSTGVEGLVQIGRAHV